MSQEQPSRGIPDQKPTLVRPTREMVHTRTVELAPVADMDSHQILQADCGRAKYELTGDRDLDKQNEVLGGRS